MAGEKILVADDETNIRRLLTGILEDEGYEVQGAGSGAETIAACRSFHPDCVLLDVWLGDMNGVEVLEKSREELPDGAFIMISGHATVDVAVQALKKGAFDFLEKPLGTDRVLGVVRNAVDMGILRKENRQLRRRLEGRDDMIGESPAMQKLRDQLERAARSDLPVFIMGENGTGKELVAREIHRRGNRHGKPFIAVNCAAIPETLIESELFGHEKGAFTGALSQRKGRFEAAHQGTLFLDEVVDLSAPAQAKVLRALQEQQFERVGGLQTVQVDVRVIAASNKDPHRAMLDNQFREDLFYRLHVFPVLVPPLRDRKEDIPLLVRHFADQMNFTDGELRIDPEGMNILTAYAWPGNIRQLRNIVQRIGVMTGAGDADADVVEMALSADRPLEDPDSTAPAAGVPEGMGGMTLSDAREAFERSFILQKLEEHGYNITRAAEDMGMYPSHLHGKLKKLGISTKR